MTPTNEEIAKHTLKLRSLASASNSACSSERAEAYKALPIAAIEAAEALEALAKEREWNFDMSKAPRTRDFQVALGSRYVSRGRFVGPYHNIFVSDSFGPTRNGDNTTPVAWRELPHPPEESKS